ncbi:oligosaccharide flippase family protein [Solimicrobium silvestre]|uniref:Polysaccharide biosynthesis protein n=1 Tax=Solimicrobium silvestre TaxID=2099400 RepID=A0A2S9GSA9_9BURK|nr:oligosaccharide flippase family protein [Solimicrobium silvestre]PRC90585.1 Polysaccharide biosynthesis protein [Solimicrobium silvestre]
MLIRNTFYNLLGLGLPLLVAIGSMPVLIHHLGDSRFGVLTLIWAVVSYFGLFDLGLGRALTQQLSLFIIEKRDHDIPSLIYTSFLLLLGLGIFAGLLMWLGAKWGANQMAYGGDVNEIIGSIHIMAIAMPFIVLTSGLRGILEAKLAFGVINLIRFPMGVFTFIGPLVVVLWYKNDLVSVTAVLTIGRIIACFAHGYYAVKKLPKMLSDRRYSPNLFRSLMVSGGWMTVSNIISPLMSYLDRFLISVTISAAAVAYYVTPNEMVTKIWIIPGALTAVLFPRFSAPIGDIANSEILTLFRSSVFYLVLIIAPITLMISYASQDILSLWLGYAFAEKSENLLKIFAYGVLLSSIAQIPFSLLQGNGKSFITARIHVAEFPVYCLMLWLGGTYFGLIGAGLIWLLRISVDTYLMFYCSFQIFDLKFKELLGMKFVILMLLITSSFLLSLVNDGILRLFLFIFSLILIAIYIWRIFLSVNEKLFFLKKIKNLTGNINA